MEMNEPLRFNPPGAPGHRVPRVSLLRGARDTGHPCGARKSEGLRAVPAFGSRKPGGERAGENTGESAKRKKQGNSWASGEAF